MDQKGILNLLALITAIETLGVAGKQIAKDGIKIDDLPKALELIKHYEDFAAVVTNFKESIEEAKDIDSAEAVQVVVALIGTVKAIKQA